jgi:DNA-directed RNA polymerase beta' subunit
MEAETIGHRAVDAWLKFIRLPVDTVVRLLPNGDTGPRNTVSVAVERFDATVRDAIGTVLRDHGLRADASRRRAAADQRERGLVLRGKATETIEAADARLRREQEASEKARAEAERAAEQRLRDVAKERAERQRRAEDLARKQEQAVDHAREEKLSSAEKRAKVERLEVLDDKERALDTEADALAASGEAQRLRKAATSAKAARKQS